MSALLQSVDTIWTLHGSERMVAIEAYARALDDVFIAGGAASALGVFFALVCKDIK